jgi:hypothetical protein
MAPGPGDTTTKPLSTQGLCFFTPSRFAPSRHPYLPLFLKIRTNSPHPPPHFPYKTLGITSQGVLENSLAHADPAFGLLLKGYPAAVVVMDERERTRTVRITGAGNRHSPIHFLTGRRRAAFVFPAAVRPYADATAQPAAIPFVSGDKHYASPENYAFRPGRTQRSTGGAKKLKRGSITG